MPAIRWTSRTEPPIRLTVVAAVRSLRPNSAGRASGSGTRTAIVPGSEAGEEGPGRSGRTTRARGVQRGDAEQHGVPAPPDRLRQRPALGEQRGEAHGQSGEHAVVSVPAAGLLTVGADLPLPGGTPTSHAAAGAPGAARGAGPPGPLKISRASAPRGSAAPAAAPAAR